MFTGIVQGTGKIVHIHQPSADFRSHTVALPEHMAHNLQIGASIAHNGCCLTITQINGNQATFDLMAETLAKTNQLHWNIQFLTNGKHNTTARCSVNLS